MHDAYTQNVQTVEIDPQGVIEGVRMNRFDPTADATQGAGGPGGPGGAVTGGEFSTLVRSILRRDPQVVAVADLPDQATAKEISKADHERTRIYVSLPAGDALTSIQVWAKSVGDARAAGGCLHGVVGQRLIRKLCTNCRVAYPPTPEMLKKLGLPEGKIQQLFKKGGQVLIKNKPETCPVCKGSGYIGQDGIFEVYSLDKEDRDLVSSGNLQGLRAAFRKRQLPTLQQVAIRKAVDGTTSVEEVLRVTTDPSPTSSSGGATPAPGAPNGAPSSPAPASGSKPKV
jgi:type II secretory ATPase GspE/PulE/Tfp pilus assembly ATPase PilB-like protein